MNLKARKALLGVSLLLAFGSVQAQPAPAATDASFTLVVLPDTQNATDYTHQKAEGFALDGADIFFEQMRDIARRAPANGGNLAFVAAVGDVWQHLSSPMDPEHAARGVGSMENPILGLEEDIRPEQTRNFEIPTAVTGYRILSEAGVPFGVAPGNHDYDAIWSVEGFVPADKAPGTRSRTVEDLGLVHVGGLSAFRSAFGSDTEFFRGKDWYLGGHEGGGSSAQIFSAGGYRFLHFAFEMHAGDDVLAWAQGIIDQNPGIPTLISTHDYLDARGERLPDPLTNLALGDPADNNSAEEIWQDFISANDQILFVFSGHQLGQATRIDDNRFGHKVYQMLSDYQARGQAGVDAGQPLLAGQAVGIGDGWYRELTFHLEGETPTVDVKTWSSHYKAYSSQLENYAQWYKAAEQPTMSDAEFLAADEFTLTLDDFRARFGMPNDALREGRTAQGAL